MDGVAASMPATDRTGRYRQDRRHSGNTPTRIRLARQCAAGDRNSPDRPLGGRGRVALFGGADLRRRGTADEFLEGRHRLLMPVPFGIRPALLRLRPLPVAAVHGDAATPDAHGGDSRGDGGDGGSESRGADDVEAGFGDGQIGL